MAIRKKTQKAQVMQALAQVAPPGEQVITSVHCETGPSPWLGILFDEIPFLSTIVYYMRKFYFITLTNTSVVINTASRFTNRPGQVVFSFPRHAFPVVSVKRARLWSSMYVMLPNSPKPTRINIDRYWRNEFDQLVAGLPQPPIPGQALPPTGMPTHQV